MPLLTAAFGLCIDLGLYRSAGNLSITDRLNAGSLSNPKQVLCISTKYEIAELRQWAVMELLPRSHKSCQECKPPGDPLLLLLCAVRLEIPLQRRQRAARTSRSPPTTSASSRGCEALQDALVRVIIDPLTKPGCYNTSYGTCALCASSTGAHTSHRIPQSPWGHLAAHYLVSDCGHTIASDFNNDTAVSLCVCFALVLSAFAFGLAHALRNVDVVFPRKLNEYQSNWAQMVYFRKNYVHEQHNMFTAGEAYYMILS
ncbi:hypothetical protein B0H14DRAFT_2642688 [Mycena olivaceomarginata]|nr:hypothetical protein B0H14DRAFT_2642688 [Mycena olivaceomarginata]